MVSTPQSNRTVRVFESVPPPGDIVKFIDEIVLHAPSDMAFSYFSWRTALLGSYDVFHVHWAEFMVRDRSRAKGLLKQVLFRLFLLRLKFSRIPVVRTVHNIQPHHAGTASEARLLARLEKLTRAHVVMSDCTEVSWPDRTVLIPHGDFREPFGSFPRKPKVPGRVLLFGRIQPYKGVTELIRAAEDITMEGVEIRVVGLPTPEMRAEIEKELNKPDRRGARVSVDLRAVSDDEMIAEMTEAELIALPYRDAGNGNSGVAMLALSIDRPVIVPRACLMERLREETGEQWVQMFDEVSGPEVEAALEKVRSIGVDESPQLIGRDWPTVASGYADVFRDVTASRI